MQGHWEGATQRVIGRVLHRGIRGMQGHWEGATQFACK
jgi:hypothetical protein